MFERVYYSALYIKRKNAKLTQAELAAAAGVGRASICRIEKGSCGSVPVLRKLAAALGCPIEELIQKNELEDA